MIIADIPVWYTIGEAFLQERCNMLKKFNRWVGMTLAAAVVALGAQAFLPSAAQAVAPCPNDYICTYEIYLAFAGNPVIKKHRNVTSCVRVLPERTYSVKNETPYDYRVFRNTQCTTGGWTSIWYAETDGNMNTDWNDDQVASFQRLL